MIIYKQIETRLDIINPNDLYCSNYNKMLLNLLNKKFLNRCYKSIYIIEIIKIVKRGSIIHTAKNLNGTSYIDLQFKIKGVVYEKNDIIHKCNYISSINNGENFLFENEYCNIITKNVFK